jgi:hypothetical protein
MPNLLPNLPEFWQVCYSDLTLLTVNENNSFYSVEIVTSITEKQYGFPCPMSICILAYTNFVLLKSKCDGVKGHKSSKHKNESNFTMRANIIISS